MNPVRRSLWHILAAVSLLLILAVAGMWVRSMYHCDILHWWTDKHIWHFSSDRGRLWVGAWPGARRTVGEGAFDYNRYTPATLNPVLGIHRTNDKYLGGAGIEFDRDSFENGYYVLIVHDAWLIALTAVLPGAWVVRMRRQRSRRLEGCCKVCGYDLRATPERCPECGTVVSPQ